MLTLYSDVHTTRRRTIHHIMNESDTLMFSAAKLGPCLEWLWEKGYRQIVVNDGEVVYTISLDLRAM